MRVSVDFDRCESSALCRSEDHREKVQAAVPVCPEQTITVEG